MLSKQVPKFPDQGKTYPFLLKISEKKTEEYQNFIYIGDGRMDSPRFSAKYCTYLGIHEQNEEIVAVEMVDKREVDLKSTSMEKEDLIRSMKSLENVNIKVKEVATDARSQIRKLVSKLWVIYKLDFLFITISLKSLFVLSRDKQMEILNL